MAVQIVSRSADDTQRVGEQLGHLLSAGDIVCLYGELGSGKTVLTKGLATGVGIPAQEKVRSPSFVLIRHYHGHVPIYHADLYRLGDAADLADIGLRELLGGDGVAVIEWAEKLEALLPAERLDVSLAHQSEEVRLITLRPQGKRYRLLIEHWHKQRTTLDEADGHTGRIGEMTSV